ncbi:MAG TPA: septal ring lytic transglycosylase RlpA family protein [Xanthobacteraceae bacterium]|nr:septal ring lytic transglycosylase RlpA family protein [Xanthobacteraceae bacterium]
MVLRLGAAICGAGIVFLCSSLAMARPEIGVDHSHAAGALGATIVGTASAYNPYHPGYREGGLELSSGERYDPAAWAAAIQTGLRSKFGGVRAGVRDGYALVEADNKKVILKIDDVGPLEPGRIIDLDERAMRYFDPTMQLGLIHDVKVTPLPGHDWTPGPVDSDWTPGPAPSLVAKG